MDYDSPVPAKKALGVREKPLVWLASYPKSGNTWTRILLSNLLNNDGDAWDERIDLAGSISSNRPRFDDITGLPSSDLTDDEIDLLRPDLYRVIAGEAEQTLFVKVHDAFRVNAQDEAIFPADVSRGVIYLVRDPRDVAISYSYHLGHENFSEVVENMCDANRSLAGSGKAQLRQHMGSWSDHFYSWIHQEEVPVLVVRYEDMLADTCAELKRMASFLNLEDADDDARIADAVQRARFDKLKMKEATDGFSEKPIRAARFFRSGRSGEGLEKLSREDQRMIIDNHDCAMNELGYEFELRNGDLRG